MHNPIYFFILIKSFKLDHIIYYKKVQVLIWQSSASNKPPLLQVPRSPDSNQRPARFALSLHMIRQTDVHTNDQTVSDTCMKQEVQRKDDASMTSLCPVCNGLESINKACPQCRATSEDLGRMSDWFGPYSPYREIDDLKMTNGCLDRTHHTCIHMCQCTVCGLNFLCGIEEWQSHEIH